LLLIVTLNGLKSVIVVSPSFIEFIVAWDLLTLLLDFRLSIVQPTGQLEENTPLREIGGGIGLNLSALLEGLLVLVGRIIGGILLTHLLGNDVGGNEVLLLQYGVHDDSLLVDVVVGESQEPFLHENVVNGGIETEELVVRPGREESTHLHETITGLDVLKILPSQLVFLGELSLVVHLLAHVGSILEPSP